MQIDLIINPLAPRETISVDNLFSMIFKLTFPTPYTIEPCEGKIANKMGNSLKIIFL